MDGEVSHAKEKCCHHHSQPARTSSDPNALYICPMHPEIRQIGQGSCPICGMALEPLIADDSENHELKDMNQRFWVSVVFSLPLFLISMGDMLPGKPFSEFLSAQGRIWTELILATPVCLWSAWPFFVRGVDSIRTKNLNMFTLIALGVASAYGYSFIASLFPGLFPNSFKDSSGQMAIYFESAAVIVTLILLGQVLELKAREKTNQSIKKLLELSAKTARKIRPDGTEQDIPLEDLKTGDHLRVRPGEKNSC